LGASPNYPEGSPERSEGKREPVVNAVNQTSMRFEFGDIEVKCSSTDRVVFADLGLTKGDVIEYYESVSELILAELAGRPITFERFNKGIGGEGYFQKHVPKYFPTWIDRVTVKGSKKKVTHAVCNKPADLIYMANQNALTFHVPTATVADLDAPDRLIFDLDPPPDRFDLVIEAARITRALFAELGLPAFCKTTGSKGLHVIAPLDRSASYAEVHALARGCAELLAGRHPDILTTEFYKKDRGDRLYLDAERNHAGATAVAAYTIRARPGAPVSMPISWDELDDPDLRPDGFAIPGVEARLDRVGDLWADLAGTAAPAGSAAEKLAALAGG
jgi:bifunctional non-homologous end joining protein LigD